MSHDLIIPCIHITEFPHNMSELEQTALGEIVKHFAVGLSLYKYCLGCRRKWSGAFLCNCEDGENLRRRRQFVFPRGDGSWDGETLYLSDGRMKPPVGEQIGMGW